MGFFTTEQPDYIFHLAAYGNMSNQRDVAMTVFANVIGTYNMLDASKEIPYKKFINFSTSSVLLPTETFYSASKAGAERLATAFAQQIHKPIMTVRPFSIYGEGEAEFRFIPTVIKSLLKYDSITLDPTPHHDWVYIGDFITTLLRIMDEKNHIVNMGTGTSYSNYAIVKFLEEIANRKLRYRENILRDFDSAIWISPENTIQSDIKKGLKKTYEYYKQRFEA